MPWAPLVPSRSIASWPYRGGSSTPGTLACRPPGRPTRPTCAGTGFTGGRGGATATAWAQVPAAPGSTSPTGSPCPAPSGSCPSASSRLSSPSTSGSPPRRYSSPSGTPRGAGGASSWWPTTGRGRFRCRLLVRHVNDDLHTTVACPPFLGAVISVGLGVGKTDGLQTPGVDAALLQSVKNGDGPGT